MTKLDEMLKYSRGRFVGVVVSNTKTDATPLFQAKVSKVTNNYVTFNDDLGEIRLAKTSIASLRANKRVYTR